MPLFRPSLLVTLSIPITGILIATYLHNRPLPLHKNRKLSTTYELSPSLKTFPRSLEIVNPRSHRWITDSCSITLLKSDITKCGDEKKEVGDEEIMARFVRGFFGGWSFTPERGLIAALKSMGRKFIEAKFSGIPPNRNPIETLEELSKTTLPEKGTVLFGECFMILDVHIRPQSDSPILASSPKAHEEDSQSYTDIGYGDPVISYVDVAFGSDRQNFSGMHRFEIRHHLAKEEGREDELTICYSSMSCNPSINKPPFPRWVFWFHCWYGMCLFRDGIEAVIRG